MEPAISLSVLGIMLITAFCVWLLSLYLHDVSIIDSFWSLMILGGAFVYALSTTGAGLRTGLILLLVSIWALRLSIYLTWRNWGEPEDRRYQAIRSRNNPGFAFKSLIIIFLFQAVLAWVIALPVGAAISGAGETLGVWDAIAILLWSTGMFFETVADQQLIRFKRHPANKDKVLNTGLWRYSRHPNYFGECLIWWGFYFFAVSSGGGWTVISPLLLTWLLLKFSGVSLLEQSIQERRPEYLHYMATTNAFLPGRPNNT